MKGVGLGEAGRYNRLVNRTIHTPSTKGLGLLVFAASIALLFPPAAGRLLGQSKPTGILGTWTGTSTCVGDRPACKNETVVYRFVPIEGHPTQVRLLADKIIDGKRVPMGALVFDYHAETGEARSEFRVGRTHGIWSYTVAGDEIKGTLVILPEGSVGRDVKAHRVADDQVPAAPAIAEYDS